MSGKGKRVELKGFVSNMWSDGEWDSAYAVTLFKKCQDHMTIPATLIIEVQLDDGLEIRDDVTFKVYADHADPPPKLMITSPESMAMHK